jgi:acyl-coenzyme A synthetase/AMP-(fatty) acid ligase
MDWLLIAVFATIALAIFAVAIVVFFTLRESALERQIEDVKQESLSATSEALSNQAVNLAAKVDALTAQDMARDAVDVANELIATVKRARK